VSPNRPMDNVPGPRQVSLVDGFSKPPASHRPAPFLVLNDEHEGPFGEARLTEILEGYKRVGYGGAFIHPRPGLITEYLSPRWFGLVRHVVSECRRLGLVPYLYDENSYPSGVGGGHVPGLVPEARTRYVTPVEGVTTGSVPSESGGASGPSTGAGGSVPPGDAVAVYRFGGGGLELAGRRDFRAASALEPGEPWVAIAMRSMEPMVWHGETAVPSLVDPRTAEAFLAVTHDAYRRELGELWNDVPAIFTDEPHLPTRHHGPASDALHVTPFVLGQFRQRKGYDLTVRLGELFYDLGEFRAVRYDFYDLMHELWVESWARPLEGWCADNGVALTGHYLEHDWPLPYATPGHVHLLAHMQWPGVDLLEGFLLDGHDFADVQNFAPAPPGREPHGLTYLRQVHSVANQLGKERVLCECWGAGGHDSRPADWSRMGRWMIVHGVNLLNPHLSFATIRGTRKADHPQTFSDHSPWFEELGPLNEELSRLCWLANQGRTEQRVLVLDPLTSGFVAPRGRSGPAVRDASARLVEDAVWIREQTGQLLQALADAQVDFDIGDEYVIEEFGRVEGDRLVIGEQRYELVVWPRSVTNLRAATAALLTGYLAGGGEVEAERPSTVTVDGRRSDWLAEAQRVAGDRWRWRSGRDDLVRAVLERVPPRLTFPEGPSPAGGYRDLAHLRRVTETGEIFVVVNSSRDRFTGAVHLGTSRARLYRFDPLTASIVEVVAKRIGAGTLEHALVLRAGGAIGLVATDDDLDVQSAGTEGEGLLAKAVRDGRGAPFPVRRSGAASAQRNPTAERRGDDWDDGEPATLQSVTRAEPNVLVVDSCRLEVGSQRGPEEAVYAANQRLWSAHGMATNGWMGVIQHRDQLLARNQSMEAGSGGVVHYRFEVRPGVATSGVRLGVEIPELWTIAVNGHTVRFDSGERWLDPHLLTVPVGERLVPGWNTVTLSLRPFDVRAEVDQIYLLGDFSCPEAEQGFAIGPPRSLGLGPWRAFDHPFYDRAVSYHFDLPAASGRGKLLLGDSDWVGSYLLVDQGGRNRAQLWEKPYEVELDAADGPVVLTVIGLPKNLLGPWHDPVRPRRRAWTPMWFGPAIPAEPQPGAAYDLLDLGLFAPPRWQPTGS